MIGSSLTDAHGALWHFFYDWQTIIAAVLAVGAAYFTIQKATETIVVQREQSDLTRKQMELQKTAEADRRNRRARAVRAALPGVLRLICEHAETVAKLLDGVWPEAVIMYPNDSPAAHPYRISPTPIPTFPGAFVEPLTSAIEHCDDARVIEMIGSIFREAQVLDSRTRAITVGTLVTLGELASYILEAAALYARAESLFAYARNHSETIDPEPLWDRVFAALNIAAIRPEMVRLKAQEERDLDMEPGEANT